MAEEQEQQGGSSMKNVIIGFVSTITLGVGGWITTKLTGGDSKDEKPAAAQPAIIINNSQQQQAAQGGKTVIVKEKAADAKPAAPAKPKKEFSDEPKW